MKFVDPVERAANLLGWANGQEKSDREFIKDLADLSVRYNNTLYEEIARRIATLEAYQNDSVALCIFPSEVVALAFCDRFPQRVVNFIILSSADNINKKAVSQGNIGSVTRFSMFYASLTGRVKTFMLSENIE